MSVQQPYDFGGKVAVITGGGGVLCSTMAYALGACGGRVVVLDINEAAAEKVAAGIRAAGGEALAVCADVLDKASLEAAARRIVDAYGRIDILINGAGGSRKEATTNPQTSFFDLPEEALRLVFDLNMLGTLLPCQVFGRHMATQKKGDIVNVASVSALRPLTRVVAYCAAKAGVVNFTQWLAVYLCQEVSPNIRVNALVPGFFLTEQNRFLLYDQATGGLTPRGQQVLAHSPMGRLGQPQDLVGPVLFLLSEGASFVHGTTLVVDGGLSAYSGV